MATCASSCEESSCTSNKSSIQDRFNNLSLATPISNAWCTKCGEEESREGCNGLCATCFRNYLYGKFKLAVTSNAMIAPTDKVLVAFSGGPASRVVLEFIHEMQKISFKSWQSSNSQSLPVFSVGIVFINETFSSKIPSPAIQVAIEEIKSLVLSLSPPNKDIHIVSIEDIFANDEKNEAYFKDLVFAIKDETGKEDFLRYLRMNALQKVALENGYNKLVLGTCASQIARHVISSTVKGQGYSLPGDIQYVDTRYKVPIILPIRDILEQELITLCDIYRLKTQHIFDRPNKGINGLVSSFVTQLREENPSREHTILRTALKLKPFKFNKFNSNNYQNFVPSRLKPKFQKFELEASSSDSDVFCPICNSPLTESETEIIKKNNIFKNNNDENDFKEDFVLSCETCKFQIIPKEGVLRENFIKLLPILERSLLREEIKDYLLDSDIDEA